MKRIFAVLLALLALFTFVACGDDEQENEQTDASGNQGDQTNGDDASDDGFIFPGSGIPGGITLPEDTFE